jgi:hypothetical protein
MYLAGILGLCALLHVPAWGAVGSSASLFALRSEARIFRQISSQQPATPDQASQQTPPQEQPKPDTSQPNPETQPANSIQEQPPPVTPGTVPKEPTKQKQKKPSTSKKRPSKNQHTTPAAASQDAQKKVVHRGGTAEPNPQLTPSITEEQAARQRQNTNDLLASTDASLQKLSGRQLTQDEQETVGQIRKFMQQVKEADKEGDLQRAYKLAVKAHLLSDALTKP